MKTYKEMAESVFRRRERYKEEQGRRREAVKAWLVCVLFAIMLSGVGSVLLIHRFQSENIILMTNPSGMEQSIPAESAEPSEPEKPHRVAISMLDVITKKEEPLTKGVSVPLNIDIDVENIKWLTNEQRNAIKKEKREKLNAYLLPDDMDVSRIEWNENTLVAVYSVGGIVVDVGDFHDIDCITLRGGYWGNLLTPLRKDLGVGHTWSFYRGVDIPSEVLLKNYENGESSTMILWMPNTYLFYHIFSDPQIDLTEIEERVQIIVWYVDGTVNVHTIDIFFDQDGIGYAMIAEERVEQ